MNSHNNYILDKIEKDLINHPSVLALDLNGCLKNYNTQHNQSSTDVETAIVVKANAYGMGAPIITKHITDHSNCKSVFVNSLAEALAIRNSTPHDIYILDGDISNDKINEIYQNKLIPCINKESDIKAVLDLQNKLNVKIKYAIQLNLQLNRLGIPYKEFENLLDLYKLNDTTYSPSLVFAQMSCPDILGHVNNSIELSSFNKATSKLAAHIKKSLSSSYGIYLGSQYHFNMTRPGGSLYGGNPAPYSRNPMTHAVHLYTKIVGIQNLDANQSVGYAAEYITKSNDTKIAVINIGYADGMPVRFNNAYAYINSHACPYIGRNSMDFCMIDVTHVPEDELNIGQAVEVMGYNFSVNDFSRSSNNVVYSNLTSFNKSRAYKVYIN